MRHTLLLVLRGLFGVGIALLAASMMRDGGLKPILTDRIISGLMIGIGASGWSD